MELRQARAAALRAVKHLKCHLTTVGCTLACLLACAGFTHTVRVSAYACLLPPQHTRALTTRGRMMWPAASLGPPLFETSSGVPWS